MNAPDRAAGVQLVTDRQNALTAVDVKVYDHGSLWGFQPLTATAREWFDEKIVDPQWWGDQLIVEHRYVVDLVDGLLDDGLALK